MWQTLKRLVSGSLRARILTILLLFNLTFLTLIGIVLYWRSSDILIQEKSANNRLELQQMKSNLEWFINEIDVITKDFNATGIVQDALNNSNNVAESIELQRSVNQFIGKTVVTHSNWLTAIHLLDLQGSNYYKGPPITMFTSDSYNKLKQSSFYKELEEDRGRLVAGQAVNDGKYVLMGRIINSTSTFKPIGILIMHVNTDAITNYFQQSGIDGTSHYLLFDKHGTRIGLIKTESQISFANLPENQNLVLGNKRYLISREEIPIVGWNLVKLTDIDAVIESTKFLKQSLFIFGLIGIVVNIIFAIIISRWISRPLHKLTKLMRNSIDARFVIKAPPQQLDEVEQLNQSYNFMMKEINELINKEYKLHLLKKEMELRALQAQINPHFIYNTLDSINWAARLHGLDDVGEMAESLANLLRTAIQGDNEQYTIRNELTYISNYISIQQYRFEDRFELEVDVNPLVLDISIPKLIIQPLLENAIIHNVDNNNKVTKINLRMDIDQSTVRIEVTDNGIGLSKEIVEEIRSVDHDENKFPRGLINVHRRLSLNYGIEYGLQVESDERGTKLCFRIPMMREGEQNGI